jgi:hypothetical protein
MGASSCWAPAADREQRLEGTLVDPGFIGLFKLSDSLEEAVEPERLIGHASHLVYKSETSDRK